MSMHDTPQSTIREEHRRAEVLRLRRGLDGCACGTCQDLYLELDLSNYGVRVKRVGSVSIITAGRTGADLWRDDAVQDTDETLRSARNAVSKLSSSTDTPPTEPSHTNNTLVMKHAGGRPRREGANSRTTCWRRKREARAAEHFLRNTQPDTTVTNPPPKNAATPASAKGGDPKVCETSGL